MKSSLTSKNEYSVCCAFCMALSAVIQAVFPYTGSYFAVHISVFLCTVLCPLSYAVLCAVLCPLLSLLVYGFPAAAVLPAEIVQCLCYAFIFKAVLHFSGKISFYNTLFLGLILSLAVGQSSGALVNSFLYSKSGQAAVIWIAAKLALVIPDIIITFAVFPLICTLLCRIGVLCRK